MKNALATIRDAAIALGPVAWDDGGRALLSHWRDGTDLGRLGPAAATVAARLEALCQTRAGAESAGSALAPELADVAILWATSAARRDDLVLAPILVATSAARPALRRTAARERLLRGPLLDALAAIPAAWVEQDSLVAHRVQQLVWEAGARGLVAPALGRWAWAMPGAIRAMILEPATGHLGDRVFAARALSLLAEGFTEDTSPSQAGEVIAAARGLYEHPDVAVWTATARGLGRMALASQSARVAIFDAASADRSDRKRRGIASLASLPYAVASVPWIQDKLDRVLDADGRADPWLVAALAAAGPHLARERPDIWYELCARAVAKPTLELGWALAQSLGMLSRQTTGYGWISDEVHVAEQLRDRLASLAVEAPNEHARKLDALVCLDRALGRAPEVALCVDEFDARIHADVGHRAAPEPTRPYDAFAAAFAEIDVVDAAVAGRAQLQLRAATRAQAMHLAELVLGLDTRPSDTDEMAARCAEYLRLEVCPYAWRMTLVGALTDLVNASAVARGHGGASARALRAVAASRWMNELATDDGARREVARFRKPLEDLFDACLGPRAALADQRRDATVPPVIAAWWILCAGPASALVGIERGKTTLAWRTETLERALADGVAASVATWGARATEALAGLDATGTVLGDAFGRLVQVLGMLEQRPEPSRTEAAAALGSLALVARAFVALGTDLDDALARGAALDTILARADDGPGRDWLARTTYTTSDVADAARVAGELVGELAPALRAIVRPIVRRLESRAAGETAFVPAPGVTLGTFKLVRKLGAGAMGEVWRAERGAQRVAIKVPRWQVDADDRAELAKALLEEAEHLKGFYFAKVATYVDAGVVDEIPFLATSFVHGATLHEHLISDPRADASGKHLPLVKRIFRDICIGLENLHDHHVIHRDLKPGNVMLRMTGVEGRPIKSIADDPNGDEITDAILIDFGIAHRLQSDGRGYTIGYAAPEAIDEFEADEPAIVGPPADVYALGATLFHVLARRPVIGTRNAIASVLWHRETEPFEDPELRATASRFDRSIREALEGSLRLDPAKRLTTRQFRGLLGR